MAYNNSKKGGSLFKHGYNWWQDVIPKKQQDKIHQVYGGKDNFYDQLIDMGYATYDRKRTLGYVANPKGEGYIDPTRTDIGDVKFFDYEIGVE